MNEMFSAFRTRETIRPCNLRNKEVVKALILSNEAYSTICDSLVRESARSFKAVSTFE